MGTKVHHQSGGYLLLVVLEGKGKISFLGCSGITGQHNGLCVSVFVCAHVHTGAQVQMCTHGFLS